MGLPVTVAAFKARFAEFVPIGDATVQANLDAAYTRLDVAALGTRYDEAAVWLAAHTLALAPSGMSARLESDKARTVYLEEYERLIRVAGGGAWAIGAWR